MSDRPQKAPGKAAPAPRIGLRAWLALVAGAFGTAAYMTTMTATGSALPHMQGTFSAAPDQMAWVLTAFLVGTTIATACIGWLDTRFGSRRLFLVASLGFAVATVLCGLSTSLVEALVFRTLQGLFGAALLPLGNAIALAAFPRERQGLATAMWCVIGNFAPTFGPFVGAMLVHEYGWAWVYFVTVPLSIGAFLFTLAFVPLKERIRPPDFDWFGFAFLAIAISALLTMLSRGERLEWFESREIVLELAVGLTAAYAFVIRMGTAAAPFVSPPLFRDRNFAIGLMFSFVHGAIVFLQLFLIPLQLQSLAGYDIVGVGELLIWRGSGFMAGALLVSWISDRVDPRIVLAVGFGCAIVSAYSMSTWSMDLRAVDVAWTIFLNGASSSVAYIPLTVLTFSTLASRFRTEGFGFYYVVSFLGTSVGTAVIFNVLTRSMRVNHDVMAEKLNPYNELMTYGFVPRLWSLARPGGLSGLDAEIGRQASMIAYNNSFLLIALAAVAIVPFIFFMRRPKI